MDQVKEILISKLERYKHLEYYNLIIEEIESKRESKPDIAIESCKSLIEGISKVILKKLDNSLSDKDINKFDFQPLFKKAVNKITEYNPEFEVDFVLRSNSLIHLLCEIRNARGDISHGRLAPKESISSNDFSQLISRMTDGILFYILSHFFYIEIFDDIVYEENSNFNDMLDEGIELGGKIKYSLALYEQDPTEYERRLEIFNESIDGDI